MHRFGAKDVSYRLMDIAVVVLGVLHKSYACIETFSVALALVWFTCGSNVLRVLASLLQI